MRAFFSIAVTTVLEIACDAVSMLILLLSMTLATLAGALHYHQFGEAGRMAREAGLSAVLMGGLAFCIFASVKAMRREIEEGTLPMILSHGVSRQKFFLAKFTGVFFAYLVFFAAVFCNSLVAVRGAQIGAFVAKGDIPKVWGTSLALGLLPIVASPVIGAILNRFCRFRFVRSVVAVSFILAVVGVFYRPDSSLAMRFLPVALLGMPAAAIFGSLALALGVKFKTNLALTVSFTLVVLSLPIIGNYYMGETLSKGGTMDLWYLFLSFIVSIAFVVAFCLAGIMLIEEKDIA